MSKKRQKMAQRFAKRADIAEQGVTISFGFKSFPAALFLTAMEETFGGLASIFLFLFHRVVLVTDQHVYIYKAKMFHRPGDLVSSYALGEGTVTRKRGKLTFSDGHVVWHSPFFAWRVKQVAAAIESGQTTLAAA